MSKILVHVKPLPQPEKRPTRRFALGLYLICCVGLLVSSVLNSLVTAGMEAQPALLVSDLLFYLPFMALPIFLNIRRNPETLEAYRPGGLSLGTAISVSLLALLGFFLTTDLTLLWTILLQKLGIPPLTSGVPDPQNMRELMLSIFSVAVLPAVCEEFCFRGAIFSALEACGTKRAMILSSLLFTGLHASLSGAPAEFLLGLVMCFLTFSCNSIYAGMIYHTVHNAASVIVTYMQSSSAESEAVTDYFTAVGGLPGVLSVFSSMALTGVLFVLVLKPFRLRAALLGVQPLPRKKEKYGKAEIALIVGIVLMLTLLYTITTFSALLL